MQTRIKRPPLRQEDIDRPESQAVTPIYHKWRNSVDIDRPCPPRPPHPVIGWLNAIAGPALTVAVLIAVIAGGWGLYLIWKMVGK